MTDKNSPTYYQITATAKVIDAAEIWKEAYRILTKGGLSDPEEIEDLIGSLENPVVEACLETILATPHRMTGCEYQDVTIVEAEESILDTEAH